MQSMRNSPTGRSRVSGFVSETARRRYRIRSVSLGMNVSEYLEALINADYIQHVLVETPDSSGPEPEPETFLNGED